MHALLLCMGASTLTIVFLVIPLYPLPLLLQPRASVRFPLGEVSLEEKEEEDKDQVKKMLSINGILKGQLLNGVCTAIYRDEKLNMRYSYKVFSGNYLSIKFPDFNVLNFYLLLGAIELLNCIIGIWVSVSQLVSVSFVAYAV